MPTLITVLQELLRLDGREAPDSPDRLALYAYVGASPWLRFAVGVQPGEPMPIYDDDGVARAGAEFAQEFATWDAYRHTVIELKPPLQSPVRFRIDRREGTPPVSFPAATFAVITAWNPGSGEPRPNQRANQRANQRLAAHLDARIVERWPSTNAPGTRWHEEGFAVLGLDLDEAWRIGEAFQQRAIYYVDRGRPLLVARRRGRVVTWEGDITIV